MEEKVCLKCNKPKPIEKFYPTRHGGRINECSECKSEYHRRYREQNGDRMKARKAGLIATKRVKEPKVEAFKPGKCVKRDCSEPRVQFEGCVKFCKSHAIDYIFNIPDV
jgi:hypothetical protein